MKLIPFAAFAALAALPAAADEGMWTFDNPPTAAIEQKYGAKLTADWLDRVRESERNRGPRISRAANVRSGREGLSPSHGRTKSSKNTKSERRRAQRPGRRERTARRRKP